jgi:hypothetical protein
VPRLTLGMAVYDDFDGAHFTVQANRLLHQNVMDDVEVLLLDNHPTGGSVTKSLQALAGHVPHGRYVPFGGYASTAVRDLIFREASSEVEVCVDSHVLMLPGALQAVLDYFEAHPGSRDLVQGPMVSDSLTGGNKATHYRDVWGGDLWGQWASDERGQDSDAEPFEIQMQGMGLFACRRDAWPGLNPRMRGHGGEEGYLHEKVRRAGGQVICHPGVAWLHRPFHSHGLLYPALWRDRARNYVIAFDELGWGTAGLLQHLHELFDDRELGLAEQVYARAVEEAGNPYAVYDAIFCLHSDATRACWSRARAEFAALGIDWLVEAVLLPPGIDQATASAQGEQAIVAAAYKRGLTRILILHDDQIPPAGSQPGDGHGHDIDPRVVSDLCVATTRT